MFFEKDRSCVDRHSWMFPYTGESLASFAVDLHVVYEEQERATRATVAKMIQDPTISHNNKNLRSAQEEIGKYGMLREQCAVWAHEFERNSEKVFQLGIGDIAFFRIHGSTGLQNADGDNKRMTWKFSYTVKELVRSLQKKCDFLIKEVATTKDPILHKGLRNELAENTLLMREFRLAPDREVHLGLGDVVYLGLAPLLN